MAVGTASEAETNKKSGFEIQTLTGWLLKQEQAGVIDAELTIVLSSISMACKQIASLVQRAGISNLTGVQGAVNVQGEDQKKLDVVSNEVGNHSLYIVLYFMHSKEHYEHLYKLVVQIACLCRIILAIIEIILSEFSV